MNLAKRRKNAYVTKKTEKVLTESRGVMRLKSAALMAVFRNRASFLTEAVKKSTPALTWLKNAKIIFLKANHILHALTKFCKSVTLVSVLQHLKLVLTYFFGNYSRAVKVGWMDGWKFLTSIVDTVNTTANSTKNVTLVTRIEVRIMRIKDEGQGCFASHPTYLIIILVLYLV